MVSTALWASAIRQHGSRPPEEDASPESFERNEPGRGRGAERPFSISLWGWRDVVWRVLREIGRDRLTIIAGGVTFYSLLAIVPGMGVFVALYGLVADVTEVNRQLDQIAAFVPPSARSILHDQMVALSSQRASDLSVAFVVSLLLSVWTTSLGTRAVVDALNVAYEETEKRNYFMRLGLTYGLTLGAIALLVVVIFLLVAAPLGVYWGPEGPILIGLRWLLVFAIAVCAFAALYRYAPSRTRPKWVWVRWGAVFAAVVWMAGSLGYSWYVNNIARFDLIYGSLGALVGFLFWIWFSVMAVLVGAELNAELEHQTALDTTVGEPKPIGSRGAVVADNVGAKFPGLSRKLKNSGPDRGLLDR